MKRFYKSKQFIILISFALIATIIPSIFSLAKSNIITNFFSTIFTPIQSACYHISDKANDLLDYIHKYDELKKENESLKDKNAELEKQISEIKQHEADYEWLVNYLDIKQEDIKYSLLDVSISSANASNYLNNFKINKGSNSGIKNGMPVITNLGLVGEITNVGYNWATVSTLYTITFGGYIEGTEYVGLIKSDYPNSTICKLTHLPLDSEIQIGDKILTTGNGNVFPKDILIGNVSAVEIDNYSQTLTAEIDLANNFESLKNMVVILSFENIEKVGETK